MSPSTPSASKIDNHLHDRPVQFNGDDRTARRSQRYFVTRSLVGAVSAATKHVDVAANYHARALMSVPRAFRKVTANPVGVEQSP